MAPPLTLEIKRARFVLGQRCLLRLRVTSAERLRIRLDVERIALESGAAVVEPRCPIEFVSRGPCSTDVTALR